LIAAVASPDLEAGGNACSHPRILLVVVVGDHAAIRPSFEKLGWNLEVDPDSAH
jgi:hypothetical protein